MEVLKAWLEANLPRYKYKFAKQGNVRSKIRKLRPTAIIAYNKNLYKTKVVEALKTFCMNGGTLVALHHNVSSMMLRQPAWLEFVNVSITKGDVPHPWGTIEGGDNYLYNLAHGNPITSLDLAYDSSAPSITSFNQELGLAGFHDDPSKKIISHEISGEDMEKSSMVEQESTIKIPCSEYFINLVLNPEPDRKLLFAIFYRDDVKKRHYISANGGWMARRGDGMLFYLMPGHSIGEYNDQFCTIIKNCLEFTEPR